MSTAADKFAHALARFVENPITNLVKGLTLLLIGISDASKTFSEDLAHGRVHVGHGLIIIGFFSILGALPDFIEGLEAAHRYLELKQKKAQHAAEPRARPSHSRSDLRNLDWLAQDRQRVKELVQPVFDSRSHLSGGSQRPQAVSGPAFVVRDAVSYNVCGDKDFPRHD